MVRVLAATLLSFTALCQGLKPEAPETAKDVPKAPEVAKVEKTEEKAQSALSKLEPVKLASAVQPARPQGWIGQSFPSTSPYPSGMMELFIWYDYIWLVMIRAGVLFWKINVPLLQWWWKFLGQIWQWQLKWYTTYTQMLATGATKLVEMPKKVLTETTKLATKTASAVTASVSKKSDLEKSKTVEAEAASVDEDDDSTVTEEHAAVKPPPMWPVFAAKA